MLKQFGQFTHGSHRLSANIVLTNICGWLARYRAEGEAAFAEARTVGELSALVEDGVNDYLVPSRDPEVFGARLAALLEHDERWHRFSRAARFAALAHGVPRAARRWDLLLARWVRP